jgi:hypothetical protein
MRPSRSAFVKGPLSKDQKADHYVSQEATKTLETTIQILNKQIKEQNDESNTLQTQKYILKRR